MRHHPYYETYVERYSPEGFWQFYEFLSRDLFLFANANRAIPISPVPLILDAKFETLFSQGTSLLWKILDDQQFRKLCAEHIPSPLRGPDLDPADPIPFDPEQSVGCLDFHLEQGALRLIEFMVLPPGMWGIYPAMLSRYAGYLEGLIPEHRPGCFRRGWNRDRCEQVMWGQITGGLAGEGIAIVDWEPESQITYGEFRYILDRIHQTTGIAGVIADPREVVKEGSRIWVKGQPVDRILNRVTLVDWQVHHDAIQAYTRLLWECPEIFVYHPYLWYLGDKTSLTLLSDAEKLHGMGLTPAEIEQVRALVPDTVLLSDFCPDHSRSVDVGRLLNRFHSASDIVLKPISSHASKGVLFGPVDTPTEGKLKEALQRLDPAEYVAMKYVSTPELPVPRGDGKKETWKCDLRVFVTNGQNPFSGGRIYLGDYTNQTPCRAFAPLFFS